MKYINFKAFGLVCAVLTTALIPAKADMGLGLDISPAKYEIQTIAGKIQTVPITVRNTGEASIHIVVTMNDYEVGPSGTLRFLKPGEGKFSLSKNASVNPQQFDVPAGSFQQVRFTASLPENASGEYQTMVFFQTRPTRRPGGVAFSERIASKMFAVIPESVKIGGTIEDIEHKTVGNQEQYTIAFHNASNIHVYLNGRVDIKKDGVVVDHIVLPNQQLVDRGGAHVIEISGKKLEPGSYSLEAYVDYGGPQNTKGQTHFSIK